MNYIFIMREMNLRSIDLNLLVILKALLEEKQVTRAAEKAGLSQPAMSRALGRLRIIFKDPLLVKVGNGLDLTAKAESLYQPLQQLLTDVHHIIMPPATDPSLMSEEIRIATRDNEMVSILPTVVNSLAQQASGITLRIIAQPGNDLSHLDHNEADFIITGSESSSATLFRKLLYKDSFVCLVSDKNPVLEQTFTLENFINLRHCLVSITGFGSGIVDETLAQLNLKRKISIRVPHFLAAAYIVAQSNLVVTVPRKVGILLSQQKNIVMLEPPFNLQHCPIYLYWHIRNQNNPVHQLVRNIIMNSVEQFS